MDRICVLLLVALFGSLLVRASNVYAPKGQESKQPFVNRLEEKTKNHIVPKNDQAAVQSGSQHVEDKNCEAIERGSRFARSCSDGRAFGPASSLAEIEYMASQSLEGRLAENNGMRIANTGECVQGSRTEANILIAKDKNGGYYWTDRKWYENQNKDGSGFTRGGISSAPGVSSEEIAALKKDGLEFVESMHNHYEGLYKWPTINDVMSSISSGKPVVVYGCNGGFYRIDPISGSVYEGKAVGTTVKWGDKPITLDKTQEWDDDGRSAVFDGVFSSRMNQDKFGTYLYDGKNPSFEQLRDWVKVNLNGKRTGMSGAVKVPDLSKLIDAMRRIAECLRRINALSSKPSEDDYSEYNKLMDKFAEEAEKVEKVLEDEIGKMKTEDEKVKFSKELGDLFERQFRGSELCNEILSLQKQIQAKGYGRFAARSLNFNAKYLK